MHDKMWLKRVLVPFWVIEMIWLIVLLALACLDLAEVEIIAYRDGNGVFMSSFVVSAAILVIMSGISLIFDITAIILLARQKLTPVTYLVFQCIKAAFWTYIFVRDMIAVANYGIPGLALLFSVVLFATSIGQLIYGSVIMHRKRAGKLLFRGNYSGVESGHLAGHESPPRGSYAAYNPHGMPPGPFRDPSPDRAPSPAPSSSTAQQSLHPAFKQSGAASDHYDATAAQQSYEMQNTAYRAS